MYKCNKMIDKLTLISAIKELEVRGIRIFTIREFSRVFNKDIRTVRNYLSRQTKKGNFVRIKNGLYYSTFNPPAKYEIANYILKPSYISFESALSHYKIIQESVYTITSTTTYRNKEYKVQNQSYLYKHLKKELFFGYKSIKIRGKIILIATPEKALLDYLYWISLHKIKPYERINLAVIDKDVLGKYYNYFKKKIRKSNALIELVKNIYDFSTNNQ